MSNIIRKLKLFKIVTYDQDKVNDDELENLYEDLVNDEYAYYICRELVDKKYIEDTFNDNTIKGIILLNKQTDCIVGFILFNIYKKYISLKLLGAIEDEEERLEVRIGSVLLELLEKYCVHKNINIIKSHVIPEAIDFYKKSGYKILEKKKDNMFLIEKNLNEEKEYIYKLFADNPDIEYDTEEEEYEEDIYNEVDLDNSDMETEKDENEIVCLCEYKGEYDYCKCKFRETYEEEMFNDIDYYKNCIIS